MGAVTFVFKRIGVVCRSSVLDFVAVNFKEAGGLDSLVGVFVALLADCLVVTSVEFVSRGRVCDFVEVRFEDLPGVKRLLWLLKLMSFVHVCVTCVLTELDVAFFDIVAGSVEVSFARVRSLVWRSAVLK
jgi:hypothetical protein